MENNSHLGLSISVANVCKFPVRSDQNSKKISTYINSSLDYLFQVVSETWQLGHTYEANTPVKHIQSQALYFISWIPEPYICF